MKTYSFSEFHLFVEIFILITFISILLLYWRTIKSDTLTDKGRVPMVYTGIPGIGFLIQFNGPGFKQKLIDMKNLYGNICQVQMGSYKCVLLNNYRTIKEAWNNEAFCGRPNMPGIMLRTRGFKGGIIFNDGKSVLEQRRFVIQHLRDLGLGKANMENIITQEFDEVLTAIQENANIPLCTRHFFNIASFNILWKIITGGFRFDYADPEMASLVQTLNRNMELNDGSRAAFFMPWLSKYFSWVIGWRRYVQDANQIFDFWLKFANEAMKDESTNNSQYLGFIKVYREQIQQCSDPTSSFYGSNGVISFATVLQDLFIAGTETTATTLQWALLYMAAFRSCQVQMGKEICCVLGLTEPPTIADRHRLPYTEAFIKEVLRFSTLAPVGMLHCTTEDVIFHGYYIPKETIVLANFCAAHYDDLYWEKPYEFNPSRFLEKNRSNIDGFIPFSTGKRVCPGAELARQTLFLGLVSIIQKYEVTLFLDSSSSVELEPKIGVSAVPYPHKIIFTKK